MTPESYHVTVTNPPYLGSSRFSPKMDKYVKEHYPTEKSDLSMVMYKRALIGFAAPDGFVAFITTSSWMFLSSFEKLRTYLFANMSINSLVDYGTELFEGKVGHNPIVSWVTRNTHVDYAMTAIRLVDYCYSRRDEKEPEFFEQRNRYTAQQDNFSKIPGSPVAYWVSEAMYTAFSDGTLLEHLAHPKKGLATTDNNRFLRLWHEVEFNNIGIGYKDSCAAQNSQQKWFPLNKGGEFRRWYGNKNYLVNWFNDGAEMKAAIIKRYNGGSYTKEIRSEKMYFRDAITWSALTAGASSFRYSDYGALFDSAGSSMFPNENQFYLLGFLNSYVTEEILRIINPTLNYGAGTIANIPIVYCEEKKQAVFTLSENNVAFSRSDWDSFETSWDFKRHPLVMNALKSKERTNGGRWNGRVKDAFFWWSNECDTRFSQLKANEEELNRIFIDIYGLQDELTPEVEEKDVTVRKADLQRDVKSLVSYAVGCMFGRYSLDVEGLAYAGGEWDAGKYKTYPADKDNIIPICDDEYFTDDIVSRFVSFIRIVYGEDTLEENLKFIADALGGKGQPRDVIRDYFLNGFYADHLKTYQKRPIYWLFDSGKKNGFKCLIYMHRYQPDMIARIRTDYVHEQQSRYRTAIADLEQRIANASTSERVKLNKQLAKLQAQADELHGYEEKIHHLADQYIAIDLDDGVKVNYAKFQDVLAKIK